MLDRIIKQTDLLSAVGELARQRRIIGPVLRNGRYFYEAVRSPAELDLSFNYCVYGPRAFLFPPIETLFAFDRSKGRFEVRPVFEDRPMALVGVHPCDINAIRLLDRVFSKDHRDEHYLRRRRNTFIVGIDCPTPCTDGVFCADMHGNEAAEGFDVMLYRLGGEDGVVRYGVVFGTEAGREWLTEARGASAPKEGDRRAFEIYGLRKAATFGRRLKARFEELPDLLAKSYDSMVWDATARRCYSCGSCNLSCPTCYCFNVFDEVDMTLESGERKREWDGCQLGGFAKAAGGHNFRPKAASRLRHRIYRKGKWVYEQTGLAGCVGCARCDRACTAKINSVEIYNQLAEEP